MYKYGMRLRGFGPGCQPPGVVCVDDGADYIRRYGRLYHSILTYDHPLTDNEIKEYERDKAKPIKPKYHKGQYGRKYDTYTCANCGAVVVVTYNYCPTCGRQVGWDSCRCLTK